MAGRAVKADEDNCKAQNADCNLRSGPLLQASDKFPVNTIQSL
jgi:hypothetical protein